MSKTNKTVEKTIVDADKMAKALMEGSRKEIQSIMEESIAKLIKEEEEDDKTENPETEDARKETEDNSFDVEDVDDGKGDADGDSETDGKDSDDEEDGGKTEDGDADDEWSELSDYKVTDDGEDYDFTGADGETIFKASRKLGDNDEIIVIKDKDGNIELKDGEAGTEYVNELNPEGMDDNGVDDTADFDIELDGSEENGKDDSLDIDLDMDGGDTEDGDDEIDLELNEEDLGYTTDYQEPVFKSGIMSGPRNYGKRGASKPFNGEVNECGGKMSECGTSECGNMEESMTLRKSYKTKRLNKAPEAHKNYVAEPKDTVLNENKRLKAELRKIYESAKRIQAENKQYKADNVKLNEAVDSIKKSLYEAAVLNKNLGRIVNLFVNETTTRDEKNEILESFNNVKTLKEGERLYESYKQKLSGKAASNKTAIVERTISMSNPSLNETTIYKNPSLDLMNRMENLFKK